MMATRSKDAAEPADSLYVHLPGAAGKTPCRGDK